MSGAGAIESLFAEAQSCRRAGRAREAEAAYRRVIALAPDHAGAHFELANLRFDADDLAAAAEHYRRTVAARPDHAAAWGSLGAAAERLNLFDEAAEAYRRALALAPEMPALWLNLGNLQRRAGQLARAEAAYRRAIALEPGFALAHNNLAIVLRAAGRAADALGPAERAIALAAAEPRFHNTLGNVLEDLGRSAEAIRAFATALTLRPDYAEARLNEAKSLMSLGRWDEAEARHDRALAAGTDDHAARFGRALVRLARGRFEAGWADYLARPGARRHAAALHRTPLAQALAGQSVVVATDQGLGDTLFFLRFLAQLRARGATVAVRPDPRLASMIARAGIADMVQPPDAATPKGAVLVADGDLPFLLRVRDGDAPPPPVRLTPLADSRRGIATRLGALGPPPYIGVSWRGGTRGQTETLYKEAPVAALAAALGKSRASVLVLQRHPAPGEIASFADALGRPAHDLSALNDDLETMLALLAAIDDYVAVSNTNVHLRASAGRTSRVLVPLPPEFRWMAAGSESPWFPGSTIYREALARDWSGALGRLAADLAGGGA